MKKLTVMAAASLLAMGATAQDQVPAFPGAEGFGRYTTGGRGGEVRHVTNLNDKGAGSLREAVNGSKNKIVVFDVSGVIELASDLKIGANTTIAGQTAPGQGITVRYYTVQPNGDNIIIRFIRFRRGQEKNVNDGADAIWTRQHKNIILDHCSFSWSIDEVASFYDNRDFTMQWCTIGEGLANPGHSKGEHSYGGIWGGKGASFHHNYITHVQNRAPRFNGARYGWTGYDKDLYPNTVQAERVDFRNCVMYNWGTGGCYGGPGGGYINMVNNYYKAGPGTKNTTRVTQVTVATSGNADSSHPELYGLSSRYYIDGNYVASASNPQSYDWSGVIYDSGLVTKDGERYIKDPNGYFGQDGTNFENNGVNCIRLRLESPIDAGQVTTHTAENAFEKVLAYCGASLSRDGVDARYMEEARTGTCTYTGSVTKRAGIIDMVADQGEYNLPSESRPEGFDTDKDGMPDSWESENGLDPNSAADANGYDLDSRGMYTNLEVYLNSLVEDIMKGGNSDAIDTVEEYYTGHQAGINDIISDQTRNVVRFEYYDLQGRMLAEPGEGISIRRIVYSDNTVEVDKVIRR